MRLHIFGASSSGVTTLGLALSEKISISYIDSDDYFWERSEPPYTIRRKPAERNALVQQALQPASWILGGSVIDWGEAVFPAFDLVVFLWIPPSIRMARLKKRELERYGTVIYTDPGRKQQYEDFLAWAADYDHGTGIANRTLQAHERWMQQLGCPVLQLRGDYTTEERVKQVMNKLPPIGYPGICTTV